MYDTILYHFIQSVTPCDMWPAVRTFGFVSCGRAAWHWKFLWQFSSGNGRFCKILWHFCRMDSSPGGWDAGQVWHFIEFGRLVTCNRQIEWNGTTGWVCSVIYPWLLLTSKISHLVYSLTLLTNTAVLVLFISVWLSYKSSSACLKTLFTLKYRTWVVERAPAQVPHIAVSRGLSRKGIRIKKSYMWLANEI
jgi:hypothetical protein